ncbi:hypothetical protein N7539_007473 [Penicillium diatomitis]|uniref:Armadillo repeat-containing protein 8 n=1 Tax=Penicillium diatomitis TaxID=2819901 RepID=A0A9W9WV95_9EURO|nr:uncharacterized protein N7539_007473 [Penicillium diatomitis]KAJ5477329.1 hypothetical protein N7539_007473 [Penicillium diatomitis]
MTRLTVGTILSRLQGSESVQLQVALLRALKNELIGHDERKEASVTLGIIPILGQLLRTRRPGLSHGVESDGAAGQSGLAYGDSEDAKVCLQAVLIVGSLAQGGPTFIAPIFASDILPTLLSVLSSPDCPPSFTLSILRFLNTIADRLPLQSQDQWPRDTRLADIIFSGEHLGALRRIIAQDFGSMRSRLSAEQAAALIGKLCTQEAHKRALAVSGVLDALAVKIASFVVAQGYVPPGAEHYLKDAGSLGVFPEPAPSSARLAPYLRAVTVIIEHSKWRAEHFLSSPGIVTVFPRQILEFDPDDIRKGPWGSTYFSGSAVPRKPGVNPVDSLLPSIPHVHERSSPGSASFPPLGMGESRQRHGRSVLPPISLGQVSDSDEQENSIVPWLLCLLRSERDMTRLMAARLVTVLFRLGLAKKHRVPQFSCLLVPILLRMLDKDYEISESDDLCDDGLITPTQRMKEEAPTVLANLVMDDQDLQKHAVDGNALKRLSQLLKETYNPVPDKLQPMWNPDSDTPARDPDTVSPVCCLGPPGYSPTLCHIMRYRESILKALAALVPFKDEYRKAVCKNGVVPYIIDALKPRPIDAPAGGASTPRNSAADGNPTATILAACGAARMLTRSASVLRTSLIDAGVAEPLFVLIKHPDIEVQIAATAAICNLALDFSPMKQAIITAGIVPILCEHARSTNIKLRIESLWALKHVVYNSPNDIRIKVIEALTPGWIRDIISSDQVTALARRGIEDEADQSSAIAMGRANSFGEQVDILNPVDDSSEQGDDSNMSDTTPSSRMSLDRFLPDARRQRKLALQGSLEQSTQSRQDDIAVQEQLFNLLRNIICGDGATEMIDYLLREIGEDELFTAIANNLRPRTIQLPHRRDVPTRPILVPSEILISASALLIHLGAGLPRHRQLVMDHPDVLMALTNYFNHSNREVRLNCVWSIINLIYMEDSSDRDGCRSRASRLKTMGISDLLARLENDPDIDVKERTKTAVHLMNL